LLLTPRLGALAAPFVEAHGVSPWVRSARIVAAAMSEGKGRLGKRNGSA
jgi:hypothetical protein